MRPLGSDLTDFSTLSVYERRICFNVLKLLLQKGPDTYKDFLDYFSKSETNEEIEQIMLAAKSNVPNFTI
jgi:ribonucleotide reductase beta subunit family protein with ferritin-like domain